MLTIQDKLEILETDYNNLLSCYQQVAAGRQEELEKLSSNDLDSLVDFLREKEAIMLQAEVYQKKIQEMQEAIVADFNLESFSLPILKEKIPRESLSQLNSIEELIKILIKELSDLEAQEIELEKMLRKQTKTIEATHGKLQKQKIAKQAYSNVPKPNQK